MIPDISDDEFFLVMKSLLEERLGRAHDPDPVANTFLVCFCWCRKVEGLEELKREVIAYEESYKGSRVFLAYFVVLLDQTIDSYAKK